MTNSFIAIRGSLLNKSDQIFRILNYEDMGEDMQFEDWSEFNGYLFDNYFEFANQGIALRGIWMENDWTIINDPEMVDTIDEEGLIRLSNHFETEIVTFVIQTTSSCYGFTVYNKTIKRGFFVSDGEVIDNSYEVLKEEEGVNVNEQAFADDILNLAVNFGIDLQGKEKHTYTVKKLSYLDIPEQEFAQQDQQECDNKKPWWKFW
ncbi:MAG TPA: hypothetical protein PK776_06550 [Flavobacterium sp.]|nr:hypothetical protein [Flavobacterium sp.]